MLVSLRISEALEIDVSITWKFPDVLHWQLPLASILAIMLSHLSHLL